MKYAIVHIADIHYRKDEPEGVSTVIKAFVKDLEKQIAIYDGYIFYIAITGDIVDAANDNESYIKFSNELNQKLDDIGLSKNFRMIVPGNHDIDQEIVKQNLKYCQKEIYDNIETEPKFNNYIKNVNNQDRKFDNYELFESDFAKFGIDFSTHGKGWDLNDNLGVYCLNTALCSLGGVDQIKDQGKLAICTRGLIDWCNDKNTSTNILLMHHHIEDLIEWSQTELKQIIENNFSLCLCGHRHEQKVFHNKISQKSLVCSTPQLFTKKADALGYAIIPIEGSAVEKIIYRQYVNGKFLNGSKFSENDEGITYIQNDYLKNKEKLELKLNSALAFFRGQSVFFLEPKLSKNREFSDEENLLDQTISVPQSTIITAQPQFGLTCLAHHMRLEAYTKNNFWIYLDAKHAKTRKIANEIDAQLQDFGEKPENIKCIIIDSWNCSNFDHKNILKYIDSTYENIPIIIMSNYSGFNFCSDFDFSSLNNDFETLHLQALQRGKVREFVSYYNKKNNIAGEDEVVTKVVNDLEVLNVHRTPLNCLTLLKVFENNFNESLLNRTKMIKAVLFILFTDAASFTYLSNKPEVEDCEYILGKFCKTLIEKSERRFTESELLNELEKYCEEKLIRVDVGAIINILETNKILLRYNGEFEFKHSYWIYYFAATHMMKDENFKNYILSNKTYVNFPEIIEFYTGIDGKREEAIQTLLNDTKELIDTVNNKIGISGKFNPFEGFVWNPTEESIEAIRQDISEKVQNSNLPTEIKDRHADKSYDSQAPYDQSINKFLNEYSVSSLIQGIKASSRALRNSNYIETDLKRKMLQSIMDGWEQISKVIFWLSPTLAQRGQATFDGLRLTLCEGFDGTYSEKLKAIYLANPFNVVDILKDEISSKKIGPLFFENLNNSESELQRHFISIFLIKEKPDGWHKKMFEYMNLLHRNSFYLGNLSERLKSEIKHGFVSSTELGDLRSLRSIVLAKHENSPRASKTRPINIQKHLSISETNKLPVDKILAAGKPRFNKQK